jgi:hypothetical protein
VTKIFKITALGIGLTAATVLAILGFAIWVFIPIMPAAIIAALAIISTRRQERSKPAAPDRSTKPRKAA